jgi:DNA-binding NtrC family response regulator
VVLTDLAMPQLDGRGLALRIQDVDAQMPVILMSGNVSSDEGLTPGAQPFAAVLHKPVDPEELFRVLAEVCEQASWRVRVAETPDLPNATPAI